MLRGFSKGCRRRPTLPRSRERSTIGAVGLNDRVRNGNECGPYALVASDLETNWNDCEDNRSGLVDREMRIPEESYSSACSCLVSWVGLRVETPWGSSQAARAIRTAALGMDCSTSTGGLST